MRQDISVRPMAAQDAPEAAGLIARCLTRVNSRDYAPEEIARLVAAHRPAAIREMIGAGDCWGCRVDGRIVGVTRLLPADDGDPQVGWLRTVFVDPAHQGRGAGRALIDAAEARARQMGMAVIRLGATITAHGFYQRLGYRDLTGELTPARLYLMEKYLTEEA